ncbi:MAG: hypothetical protein LBB49_01405 [Gracilibacteraceae bacterium]|nr:hypothetical protein [Gracilibacteraceae bacterium]
MFRHTLPYRPLYFLSALGAGGLMVSVFMYFMFLVPHPDTPMPTFSHLADVFAHGSVLSIVLVSIAIAAIVLLAVLHFILLTVNLRAHFKFRRTEDFQKLLSSNGEVTLMAIPLTLAMTINVLFVGGAIGVPGLWNHVESLFPFSLAGFAAVGIYALAVFGRYLTRIMSSTEFNSEDTNHFSQILPSFTFSMVAVGFAAPAAMSHNITVSALGMVGAFLFASASVIWAMINLPVSMGMILRKGMAKEAGPTLWIGIPILTLLGITFVRVGSGLGHNFLGGVNLSPPLTLVVLGLFLTAQVLMGLLGWSIMHRQRYFSDYVFGDKKSIATYGLACPGVAFCVLSMFFLDWGLVRTEVLVKYTAPHITLVVLAGVVQVVTIALILKLNNRLYGGSATKTDAKVKKSETP